MTHFLPVRIVDSQPVGGGPPMTPKAIVASAFALVALATACATVRAQSPAAPKPEPSTTAESTLSGVMPLEERVLLASKIYAQVTTFFPELSRAQFEGAYAAYVARILRASGRREFDWASMELLASLHDGHTWFDDPWLERASGQPVGFIAYPVDAKWTVVRSLLDVLRPGDIITAIDETPFDDFFARQRRYVSASSDREAALDFFETPLVFPNRFRLTLADGRHVAVDRKNGKQSPAPAPTTEGRWLTRGAIAYVKVPTFQGIEMQTRAIEWLRQFHDAKAIIVDVRGNRGGGYPIALTEALMTEPYRAWTQSSAVRGGELVRTENPTYSRDATLIAGEAIVRPRATVYGGRLILLIDRACASGCEDFVMPFKTAKRATLVGETTAGTFSDTARTAFDNGMLLNIAAVRKSFPDGTRFEGTGIAPDVAVATTAEDLAASHDNVLHRAVDLANP
ncbi:MAG TPA: S41 family peptidase [Polyangiaceae bacterium]|nr:S41 family peptidase [Polyangiaceae bacterium]